MTKQKKIKQEKFKVVTKDFTCTFKIKGDTIIEISNPLERFKDTKIYNFFEWLELSYTDYKISHAK